MENPTMLVEPLPINEPSLRLMKKRISVLEKLHACLAATNAVANEAAKHGIHFTILTIPDPVVTDSYVGCNLVLTDVRVDLV